MQCVRDENGAEIGWLVDAWRARCIGWDSEQCSPLPDYQVAVRRRSRSDATKRSIPDCEYIRLAEFIRCIASVEWIREASSLINELPQASKAIDDDAHLCWRLSRNQFSHHGPTLSNDDLIESDMKEWCNTLIHNPSEQVRLLSAFAASFYIPTHSSFLISDISDLSPALLSPDRSRFHLIMMDPPWDNKSVQRSNAYPTLRHSSLKSLPIDSLLDEEHGVVVIWVTNDPKFRTFISDELLPHWNMQFYTVWYWLKLPLDLQLDVKDLDSVHHKPYEQIIIGVRRNSNLDATSISIPKDRIIASFPESHSRKPVLDEVFDQFMPNGSRKLEIFARDVKPGWTAWGNEPLKFQNSKRFQLARHNKRKPLYPP